MIYTIFGKTPQIDEQAWIAHNADVIGSVHIKEDASIFFQSVVRGDKEHIEIGIGSNIQDHCTLHCDTNYDIWIGDHVSVGHGCILHGCHIGDETLIGMGAIIMNGAHIGKHCIVGAGALVLQHMEISDGSVLMGVPAKVVGKVRDDQIQEIKENAAHYVKLAKEYKKMEEK